MSEQTSELYQHYQEQFPAIRQAQNGEEFLFAASLERDGKVVYVARDQFSDDLLLEFSLVVGIFHLSIAFARYAKRNLAGIGWIAFMIGGYLFLPTSLLDATSILHFMGWVSKSFAHLLGIGLLWSGAGLAILFSMIQNGVLKGMMEPLQAIQIFGDVLSYLRIYALGLAGVIVASTFNSLGMKFGFLAGVLILISGHALNIALSVMAGFVHGLRLNFLEWYHYCFEGGGKRFNPLRLYIPK
jgi:V/A-type H+-transporting ATPase subunit I